VDDHHVVGWGGEGIELNDIMEEDERSSQHPTTSAPHPCSFHHREMVLGAVSPSIGDDPHCPLIDNDE
jgi:hypothetical protein